MSYKKIMNNNAKDVHNSAIATKILQHISRVRDNRDDMQARRFIWELIQNAKDAKYADTPVKIKVELFYDKLLFSHTGRPFRVKNILSIINQVSSKLPDDEETTGQFGTGFVTTHLLSEKVGLKSICEDSYEGEALTAKEFEILLDRSGNTQEEIMEAVNNAINIISELDNGPDVEVVKEEFNTTFTYQFQQKHCFQTAKQGMDDLKYSIIYALAFVKGIGEVTVINHTENDEKVYRVKARTSVSDTATLEEFQVTEEHQHQITMHKLLLSQNESCCLAMPLDYENSFQPIHPDTPRLFCDFPLIGSEKFPYPVVIHSRGFQPNETRSSIPISNNIESVNSNHNKKILQDSLGAYREIIAHYERFHNICHICNFIKLETKSDFDDNWFTEYISKQLFHILFKYPIIDTTHGKALIEQVYFPKAEKNNRQVTLSNLVRIFDKTTYVLPVDVLGWNQALYNLPMVLQKQMKTCTLRQIVNMDDKLLNIPLAEGVTRIEFLNTVYEALLEDSYLAKEFYAGEIKILPDQDLQMNLHGIADIYRDPGIDEYIKKASDELDHINYNGPKLPYIKIRKHLLHEDFVLEENTKVQDYNLHEFAEIMEKKIFPDINNNCQQIIGKASDYLIACCQSNLYYRTLQKVKKMDIPYEPAKCQLSQSVWTAAIHFAFTFVKNNVAKAKNIKKLQVQYLQNGDTSCETEEETIVFLRDFYQCIGERTFQSELKAIFLNQNKNFCYYSDLKSEENLHVDLKQITSLLASDFLAGVKNCYDYLLDTRVGFSLEKKYTMENIAYDITNGINRVLNGEGGLNSASDQVCEGATLLLSYIEEHESEAEKLFTAFYKEENRMKLLTTKAASRMAKRLKSFESILTEENISEEQLKELISSHKKMQENLEFENNEIEEYGDSEIDFSMIDWDNLGEDFVETGIDWNSSRDAFAHRVGMIGEKLAYQTLVEKEDSTCLSMQREQEAKFVYADRVVEIKLADTEHYKQSGYDIIKTVTYADDDRESETYYFEVKSTVRKNTVHSIKLSYQQFLSAMKHGSDYTVMRMCLTKTLDLQYYIAIKDILSSLKNQEIQPTMGIELYIK